MTLLSFPDRGPEGDSQYRGNCSGHIFRHLIEHTRTDSLLDVTLGSGTGAEVALAAGLRTSGADLRDDPYMRRVASKLTRLGAQIRTGFDSCRDSLSAAFGEHGLVFSHPPYASMISYSQNPHCLSQQGDDELFFEQMQAMTLNMREATRIGGHYVVLVGDLRRRGVVTSLQAEILARMPRKELRAVNIKAQHHCVSDRTVYRGDVRFGRIEHEYLLIWERTPGTRYETLAVLQRQDNARTSATWRNVICAALTRLGGRATLEALYREVYDQAPEKVGAAPHWQAKVRQTVQLAPNLTQYGRGVWGFAAVA